MSTLKLKMLPDRETSKITFAANAELRKLLEAYAELYAKQYGKRETAADLIPYMLEAFISSDRQFRRAVSRRNKPSAGHVERQQEPRPQKT
jgi:hypothetical protein